MHELLFTAIKEPSHANLAHKIKQIDFSADVEVGNEFVCGKLS